MDDIHSSNLLGQDPSPLTIELMRHELKSLRDLFESRINGMDKANELLSKELNRYPTDTDRQVTQLKDLSNEKFFSVQKQFDERDIRTRASEVAAQTAVNAALQAQKEAASAQNDSNAAAITKSEASTVKQIDGITALLASNTKAMDEKIASINGRLDRGEGTNAGKSGSQATLFAVAGLVVSLAVGAIAVVNFTRAPISNIQSR